MVIRFVGDSLRNGQDGWFFWLESTRIDNRQRVVAHARERVQRSPVEYVCNDRIRHREPENGPHRACALRHFEFDELGSVAPDAFHGILDDFGDD